jgi:hypothetical protein
MKHIKLVRKICKEYNIKLKDLALYKDPSKFGDGNNYNTSWIIGHNEIWLGIYDDNRFKFISFFHEMGHTLLEYSYHKKTKYNTLMAELKAWDLGINFALNRGIIFEDDVLEWGYKRALTYVGHDKREYRTPIKERKL